MKLKLDLQNSALMDDFETPVKVLDFNHKLTLSAKNKVIKQNNLGHAIIEYLQTNDLYSKLSSKFTLKNVEDIMNIIRNQLIVSTINKKNVDFYSEDLMLASMNDLTIDEFDFHHNFLLVFENNNLDIDKDDTSDKLYCLEIDVFSNNPYLIHNLKECIDFIVSIVKKKFISKLNRISDIQYKENQFNFSIVHSHVLKNVILNEKLNVYDKHVYVFNKNKTDISKLSENDLQQLND